MFEESLEEVEKKMKLEKVKQAKAQTLSWADYGEALKRTLKEKKLTFDADVRLDMMNATKIMRKSVPIDRKADLFGRLRQLCESMECAFIVDAGKVFMRSYELNIELRIDTTSETITQCIINLFGKVCDSPEGKALLNQKEYETFRQGLYTVMNSVPPSNNHSERIAFAHALELVESWLGAQQAKQCNIPTFQNINSCEVGYSLFRNAMRLTRIYYYVEPYYEQYVKRNTFNVEHDLNLPHIELSLIRGEKDVIFPDCTNTDLFGSKTQLNAIIALKLSTPLQISRGIWLQLQRYMPIHPSIRDHINIYTYTSGFDKKKDKQLIMRTNFPSNKNIHQHRYTMRLESLQEEDDVIASEIFIEDIKNLEKVLALLRTQHIHNTLWESLLCVTRGEWKGQSTIKLELTIPLPTKFEFKFIANERLYLIKVEETKNSKRWGVQLLDIDGRPICTSDIDNSLTIELNKHFNLPNLINETLKVVAAQPTPDPSEPQQSAKNPSLSSFMDKIGQSWLPRPRPIVAEIEPTLKVEVTAEKEEDVTGGMGFLSLFREVEDISALAPNRPEALPRNARLMSEQNYSKAFSDLEAFCQFATEPETEEQKKPTTPFLGPAKLFDTSPAPRHPGITQLSRLENARLCLSQASKNVSLPPGIPSTTDVFDFPDDKSAGSGSPYLSPSPLANSFSFTAAPTPAVRGAKTRRPRQRKAGNIGDRTGGSTDSNAEQLKKIKMQKSSTMGSLRGTRGRGSRKSSGLPLPAELERPVLQRSYSDYMNQSSFNLPPQNHIPSPLISQEDDDDDEVDPPPPPKAEEIEASRVAREAAAAAERERAQAKLREQAAAQATSAHATTLSSLLTNESLEKLRIQPSRKNSFEIQPKKTSFSSMPPQLSKKTPINHVSDIYDDGLDSPPPGLTAMVPLPITTTSSSSSLPSEKSKEISQGPPVLTAITKVDSPLATNSPKAESVGSNSNDGPPKIDKIEPSKIILKISKQQASSPSSNDPMKGKLQTAIKSDRDKPFKKKEKAELKTKEPKEDKKSARDAEKSKEESASRKRGRGESMAEEKVKPATKRARKGVVDISTTNDAPAGALPFFQQTLKKNFKIPKKEDKDSAAKEPITPTTPLAPPLTSPIGSSQPAPPPAATTFPPAGPSHPPLSSMAMKQPPPPLHKKASAAIRLNLPATQPATYLPKPTKPSPIPLSNRRYSNKEPPEPRSVANIPMPKERAGFIERSTYTGATRWVKASAASVKPAPIQVPTQATPRSPSPEAMQIDETSSPEDSLRISEDA